MTARREEALMAVQEVETPSLHKTQVLPKLCPVCRTTGHLHMTIADERAFAAHVAVSDQWETVDGDDLYLVTCADHSLADVFAQRCWNGRR